MPGISAQTATVLAAACLFLSPAHHADVVPSPAAPPGPCYVVTKHLFARSVGFDASGNCRASRGKPFRHWRLPGFPARIPAFESCTTIKADQGNREVDFEMRIVTSRGRVLQKVDGVLALSESGLASQAIAWEHLEIPRPGRYHMEIRVAGQLIARLPMRFSRARKGRKVNPASP